MTPERTQNLIRLLMDKSARIDERDDAAIDLIESNSGEALAALINVAAREGEPEILQASCGEAIGEIWIKRNVIDIDAYEKLNSATQLEIKHLLMEKSPHLHEKLQSAQQS